MIHSSGFALTAGLFSALCLFGPSLGAQATLDVAHVRPADRVRGRVDEDMLVKLRATRYPLARQEYDAGRGDARYADGVCNWCSNPMTSSSRRSKLCWRRSRIRNRRITTSGSPRKTLARG